MIFTWACIFPYLILLDQTLAFLMHINAAMLPVMNLVMSYNRVAIRTDLNPSQGVSIYIIMLDKSSAFAEYIDTALGSMNLLKYSLNELH